jgi:hypothetical protein
VCRELGTELDTLMSSVSEDTPKLPPDPGSSQATLGTWLLLPEQNPAMHLTPASSALPLILPKTPQPRVPEPTSLSLSHPASVLSSLLGPECGQDQPRPSLLLDYTSDCREVWERDVDVFMMGEVERARRKKAPRVGQRLPHAPDLCPRYPGSPLELPEPLTCLCGLWA